jgi:N4-(beta-N-acetylglucosaminyl)-L-asparaginase
MKFTRRDFLATTAVASAALALDLQAQQAPGYKPPPPGPKPKAPVIICAANGYNYLDRGYAVLTSGGDTLDAVMQVITGPEDDPNDDSVGLGGLPNEECVVELDACCMHGPTRMAGSVAGVHDIKNVSLLAKTVMEHTGHVMLVGEGASKFGLLMGFPKQNLLTERSRKTWQLWRETMSNDDWWGPGLASPNFKFPDIAGDTTELDPLIEKMEKLAAKIGIEPEFRMAAIERVLKPPTGNGEENIKIAGGHTIVENMRHGMSPEEAGLDALRRIVRNYNGDMRKLQYVDMSYYILRNDGVYAGVSLWAGSAEHPRRFAVDDEKGKRYEKATPLFQGASLGWPPMPGGKRLKPEQK